MKKYSFVGLFIMGFILSVQSQHRLGFTAGGVYAKSNLTAQDINSSLTHNVITFGGRYSYFAGLVYDVKLTNEFSITSKLLLTQKGWTETSSFKKDRQDNITDLAIGINNLPEEITKSQKVFQISYVELPVNFTFYTPFGRNLVAFGVGPYIGFALKGHYRFKSLGSTQYIPSTRYSTVNGLTIKTNYLNIVTNNIPDSSSAISFSQLNGQSMNYQAFRIDYGATINIGIQWRMGLFLNVGYSFGIKNVFSEQYEGLQNRHRDGTFALGYYISKKKRG